MSIEKKRDYIYWQIGFSLFELLIVISIIGILTAIVSVAYSGAQKKTRDVRRIEDLKLIQTAAEQYYSQNAYSYPTTYSSGDQWSPASGVVVLESYPSGPKGEDYSCATDCNASGYCICVAMENSANSNANVSCQFNVSPKGYFCVKNQQ
ncbi:MAG: type II secretion system protein [Candidatus Shapirobacteria bacterium]|jgi:prepilin-type N-terminal cleavage/methylation domain-containing protein